MIWIDIMMFSSLVSKKNIAVRFFYGKSYSDGIYIDVCVTNSLIYIDVCVTCSVCFSGLTYLVYPGAVHTRFEHSLGVYQLAGEAVQNLQMNQVGTIKHIFADIYCRMKISIK
jgi:hypothetical protein